MDASSILSLSKGMKLSDHVFLGVNRKGNPAILQTDSAALPRGIYFLVLDEEILYVGISTTEKQATKKGIKQRLKAHGQKITGVFTDCVDTARFRAFREENLAQGKDLLDVMNRVEMRFIPMEYFEDKAISDTETAIVRHLVTEGHCRLNGAKRG